VPARWRSRGGRPGPDTRRATARPPGYPGSRRATSAGQPERWSRSGPHARQSAARRRPCRAINQVKRPVQAQPPTASRGPGPEVPSGVRADPNGTSAVHRLGPPGAPSPAGRAR
jgi:hypothetical protein